MKAWGILSINRKLFPDSIGGTRRAAIGQFERNRCLLPGQGWDYYRKLGCKCVRVEVKVIGETGGVDG